MSRAVMQQALEALVAAYQGKDKTGQVTEAITALRAALAEPEQEPVAWLYTLEYGTDVADRQVSLDQKRYPFGVCGADYLRANADGTSYVRETALYTAPTPRKPQTTHWEGCEAVHPECRAIPRKPLTDEEIVRLMVGEDRVQLLYAKPDDPYFSEFAQGAIRELVESGRAIERAHGIGEQT